jgi:hypothetical protein
MAESGAECFLHVGDGARELDGAALGSGGIGFDLQAELAGELADEGYGFGVGPVKLAILRAGEALLAELDVERIFAANDNGDDDALAVRRGLFGGQFLFLGWCEGSLLAAGQHGAADYGGGRGGFFGRHKISPIWIRSGSDLGMMRERGRVGEVNLRCQ